MHGLGKKGSSVLSIPVTSERPAKPLPDRMATRDGRDDERAVSTVKSNSGKPDRFMASRRWLDTWNEEPPQSQNRLLQ